MKKRVKGLVIVIAIILIGVVLFLTLKPSKCPGCEGKLSSLKIGGSGGYLCVERERKCELMPSRTADFRYSIRECRTNVWINIGSCAINQECSNGECIELEGLGTAILSPTQVIAGSNQRFYVNYTVQTPISTGGQIKIYFGTPFFQSEGLPDAGMQNKNENDVGYVEVSTSNQNVRLGLTTTQFGGPHSSWTRLGEATISVVNGTLNQWDNVTLVYGAGQLQAYAQEIAHDAEVTVRVSLGGKQEFGEIQNSPVLAVLPKEPYKLISAVNLENNELKLSIVDVYGNLVDDYSGQANIFLINETNQEKYLDAVEINSGRGTFQIPTRQSGYYVIKTATNGFESKVPFTPGKQNVYFGDLHFHTRLSDTYVSIDPIDSYEYAKDTALLDFLAVSDHSEAIVRNEIFTQFLTRDIQNSWEEIKKINREFNSEGNFVTFLGYETTSGKETDPRDGHVNVYYNDSEGEIYPHCPSDNNNCFTNTNELWEKLRIGGKEALTIQHHTLYNGSMGSNLSYYNANYEKLIEIYSHHGNSECETCENTVDVERINKNGSVQRALGELGYKLGFIGGSDNHFGHPSGTGIIDGKGKRSGGMTAVIAESLTKNSLWSAMNSRSAYATSGERIYLEFNISGAQMGSEIETLVSNKPVITARAIGTNNIQNISIIKYDSRGWKTIYSSNPDALFVNFSFTDTGFNQNSIYYLRVKQEGNEQVDFFQAWSSPIWVAYSGKVSKLSK